MTLPNDDAELEALIAQLDPTARTVIQLFQKSTAELQAHLRELKEQLAVRDEQLAEFQRMLFGKRSEKLPSIQTAVRRAVEADEFDPPQPPPVDEAEAATQKKEQENIRRKRARKKSEPTRKKKRALRKNLPVVHEQCVVSASDLPEGYVLSDFRELTSSSAFINRVEHVREHLVVVEYKMQTLVSSDGEHLVKAVAPPTVTEDSHYGPGLHAHVVVSKCADSLPLHRVEQMLERAGHAIARSTLCTLFHRCAELFAPIYNRMLEVLREDEYLYADETTLKVQAKGECDTGWVWAMLFQTSDCLCFRQLSQW